MDSRCDLCLPFCLRGIQYAGLITAYTALRVVCGKYSLNLNKSVHGTKFGKYEIDICVYFCTHDHNYVRTPIANVCHINLSNNYQVKCI